MSFFINVEDLTYKNILKNIDIEIRKNELITISGSNKCGKTTLIKLLDRRLMSNNSITIDNKLIEDYNIKDFKDMIGTVIYSDKNIFSTNTVEEELISSLKYDQKDRLKRYKEIVSLFKLKKYINENPNNLDNKLKMKLKLAKEIISKPQILLLDDVFLGLNKKEKKELMDIIKLLKTKENMTIVLSTNNLEETIDSDYIYIMSQGEIVLEGEPLEVLEKDNTLNKIGLDVPFMIDLSVKLRDYDLIKDIELDMDRMVDILWK